jgi:hypothetical protein
MSGEEETPAYSWTANQTNLCYESEGKEWCGTRSECVGLVLPLFFEDHWDPGFRAFLYVFGLLYR